MISRVAEHCFWLSRYLERLENTARVIEVNQTLLLDFRVPTEHQWKPLLTICGIHDLEGDLESEQVQRYLTWEVKNPSSICNSLGYARENARVIREVVSAEMWERLNHAYLWLKSNKAQNSYETNRSEFYNQIRRINQMIWGIAEGTMGHGEPMDFFKLGRYLERACQTARILDVKYHQLLPTPQHLGTAVDSAYWSAILTSCSAYEPYLKQKTSTRPVSVSEFLVMNLLFPRSVRYCLRQCQSAAHTISGRPLSRPENDVEKQLCDLLGWLQLVDMSDIVEVGLHESLTKIIDAIHEIGDAIHRTYFDVGLEQYTSSMSEKPPKSTTVSA
ncbi:MAG: alpha-E domain-containing protein [Gemmataceae bacterium]